MFINNVIYFYQKLLAENGYTVCGLVFFQVITNMHQKFCIDFPTASYVVLLHCCLTCHLFLQDLFYLTHSHPLSFIHIFRTFLQIEELKSPNSKLYILSRNSNGKYKWSLWVFNTLKPYSNGFIGKLLRLHNAVLKQHRICISSVVY